MGPETYEKQGYNPLLVTLPALDGRRHGRVLTCIDRGLRYDGTYAKTLQCPPNATAHACHSGEVHMTKKHTFLNEPIYAKMLVKPAVDIGAMKAAQWLDLQTDVVTLSTMVYTEGVEIFTNMAIEFSLDEAGNVNSHAKLLSYRDLVGGTKTVFIIGLVICIVGALIGVVLSIAHMMRNPEDCKWGYELFELFSRGLLFVYPLVLVISWSQQVPMSKEYDELLHTFIDAPSISEKDMENILDRFFKVKEHLHGETSWLKQHRICAYVVCYFQFLQFIFYCSAHPKMGVLTSTIIKAFEGLINFLLLFSIIFMFLAFLAHWMLGSYIKEFGTMGDAISAQARMTFGEFIYAGGAEDLHGVMMLMYWVYAFTFMIIAFFTLLNFFLAIVIGAFTEVKGDNDKRVGVGGFFTDLFASVHSQFFGWKHGWPSHKRLVQFFLDELVNFQLQNKSSWLDELEQNEGIKEAATEQFPAVSCDALQDRFKVQFSEPEKVARFLCFYFRKYPTTLCRRSMKKQGSGMVGNSHGVDSFKAGGTIKMDKLS